MNRSGIEINTWSLDSNYSPEHVKCIEMQHQPFWFCILPWCAWTWNRASVDIIKHYITQTRWKPILQLLVFMHFTVQWGNNFKSLLDLILRIHPVDGHGEPQCRVPLQIHLKNRGEVFDLFIQLADPTCAIGFVTVAPLAHYVTGWDCWEGGSWLRCDRFQPNGSKWWFGLWCFSKGSSSKLALFHILFQYLWSCCWCGERFGEILSLPDFQEAILPPCRFVSIHTSWGNKAKDGTPGFRSSDSILAYPCSTEMIPYDCATFGRGSRCFLMGFHGILMGFHGLTTCHWNGTTVSTLDAYPPRNCNSSPYGKGT